ncbi:hypothetical protein [Leptospira kirschneri]|uniref:Uncharacterized protein n=2 Tax=Leptospira kirschneri TaxID=29507 RepID=A0A0E2B782_9LEPT|nr:hypothetical protein [Leptospira kirschneri]EJO70330.1 hypothetical protein LEP1GSC044_1078 [Leptospira kirschneri serovar Grippotyphosa str. RM52]EKO16721.1 hypothetical protein LEP1GSC081_2701 [Leptospira kirschneri str. H1]EKO52345.1 hypothetical protein LEP1GSC131_4491 [Leptospira kirschneri str. 200802841]EKO59306.1 hypothetical protein LEP1GSC082_4088 [Leptospira kirschneri str. H2]EKP05628.1 hypothetical protein LEP1GSC018_3941 [Leptospira kirschneri str. 2008720114]EKQ84767.1 hypot
MEIKNTKEWVGYTGFLNVSFTALFTTAVEIGWRLNSSFGIEDMRRRQPLSV